MHNLKQSENFDDDCINDKQFMINMLKTKHKNNIMLYACNQITKQELIDSPDYDSVATNKLMNELINIVHKMNYTAENAISDLNKILHNKG